MSHDPFFSAPFLLAALSIPAVSAIYIQKGFLGRQRFNQFFQLAAPKDYLLAIALAWQSLIRRGLLFFLAQSAKGAQHLAVGSVSDQSFLETIHKGKFDLLVSFNGVEKWPPALLQAPRLGCLNVHLGKLPNFRGVNPVIHALASGARQVALSFHTMTSIVDGGQVLISKDVKVAEHGSIFELYRALNSAAAELLPAAVDTALGSGRVRQETRRTEAGRYFSYATVADIRVAKRQFVIARDIGAESNASR